MSENNLLDRELYRKIKNMDKNTLNTFIQNIYNTGKKDALSEVEIAKINIEQIRIEISEIKGIGETRLNQIMDIISKNIWQYHYIVLYWIWNIN